MDKRYLEVFDDFKVEEAHSISLSKIPTDIHIKPLNKEEGEELLKKGIKKLSEIQDKLYAHNRYRVLIIFQAMDAAGKDSAIKHIMSGLNPQGVKVHSFKTPTSEELDHDYLWRHYKALPARGEIGIFNRSHYENVLITRVHPEYILKENIPGIDHINKINQDFWANRFEQINQFENHLYQNGTIILKFFLHLSKEEQKKRFLERLNNPAKNWKFSPDDIKERKLWDKYQHAYAEAISATSKKHAPWFIVPADDKWYARLAIAGIIYDSLSKLNIQYPETNLNTEQISEIRNQLEKD